MLAKLYARTLGNPVGRLVARSLLAGATVFWYADDPLNKAVLASAVWAAVEAFTPLNALVGLFKKEG